MLVTNFKEGLYSKSIIKTMGRNAYINGRLSKSYIGGQSLPM